MLLTGLGEAENDAWQHLRETRLAELTTNTLILVVGVGLLTLMLGTSLALITARFDFPGSRLVRVGLLMPLALPSYIAAYAFSGALDYAGPIQQFFAALGIDGVYANVMNIWGLIVVLSLVLYPYVYATVRVALESRYNSYIETAKSLGLTGRMRLQKILLPLLRPAMLGGVFLVMMEVLNDYGAMKYFGIPTYTTGIFTAWFSMGDLGSAVRLALMLFALVGVLGFLESWYHRRFKVSESHRSKSLIRSRLQGRSALAATACTYLVLFLAFVLPVLYLIWILYGADLGRALWEWPRLLGNSLIAGISGALLVLFVVLFTQFVRLLVRNRLSFFIGKSISVGYSLPGAIIAVGVLLFSSQLDRAFSPEWALTGSLAMLIFAYGIRFAGVAYQPLHAESEKRSARMFEAFQSLGKSPAKVLRSIYLPLSRPGIKLAAILVVIDVLKELPLTLILRPFNFSTLATKAFEYASDEMLSRAALPALSVVAVGLIPVLLLHRTLRSS